MPCGVTWAGPRDARRQQREKGAELALGPFWGSWQEAEDKAGQVDWGSLALEVWMVPAFFLGSKGW